MSKKCYYDVLGVKRDESKEKIKKAYKKMAMKHHPDRNKDDPKAEERFKEVNEAHDILSDDQKRAAYDQHGHAAFESGGHNQSNQHGFHAGFAEFAERFGFGAQQQRGSDLRHDVEITLEQAAKGIEIQIEVPTMIECAVCHGSRAEPGSKPKTCPTCNGHGHITRQHMHFVIQQPCHTCGGVGTIIESPCKNCHGNGWTQKNKQQTVNIPAGIDTGNNIRITGSGEHGQNGALAGDLYVVIHVKPHDKFKRDRMDLHCEVPISIGTAALGGEINVPTFGGEARINIPAETQTGKQFRLRGKGIKNVHNSDYGDLYCHVIVKTPINLTEQQKKIMQEFK